MIWDVLLTVFLTGYTVAAVYESKDQAFPVRFVLCSFGLYGLTAFLGYMAGQS